MADEPKKEEVKEEEPVAEEQKVLDREQAGTDAEDKLKLAVATAKRIEDGNKKYEELLAAEARMKTIDTLGGKSELSEKPSEKDKQKEASRKLVPKDLWDECGLGD